MALFKYTSLCTHCSIDLDGHDLAVFKCTFSPAKRRGPIPGRATSSTSSLASYGNPNTFLPSQHSQSVSEANNWQSSYSQDRNLQQAQDVRMLTTTPSFSTVQSPTFATSSANAVWNQPLALRFVSSAGMALPPMSTSNNLMNTAVATTYRRQEQAKIQSQLTFLQQEIDLQHWQIQQRRQDEVKSATLSPQTSSFASVMDLAESPLLPQRKIARTDSDESPLYDPLDLEVKSETADPAGLPRTVMTHVHLLDDDGNGVGLTLRAYYRLSVDEMFRLPCTPSLSSSSSSSNAAVGGDIMVQGRVLTTLTATRFIETALGAVVQNEIGLAVELCNAAVHCISEVIQDTVIAPIVFHVAKTCFLIGIFQVFRDDMPRYFNYRRACLYYLSRMEVSSCVAWK
jgi:hypothetical protein